MWRHITFWRNPSSATVTYHGGRVALVVKDRFGRGVVLLCAVQTCLFVRHFLLFLYTHALFCLHNSRDSCTATWPSADVRILDDDTMASKRGSESKPFAAASPFSAPSTPPPTYEKTKPTKDDTYNYTPSTSTETGAVYSSGSILDSRYGVRRILFNTSVDEWIVFSAWWCWPLLLWWS